MADTITIDRAEYDRLCAMAENFADLQVYNRTMDALERGEEELIPAAYVERMIAGESPLRVFRDLRGLTQSALSEASGVNRVQIADIEAGRKHGSINTQRKLANALGVTIDDLV